MNVKLNWIKDFGYLAKSGSGHAVLMDAPLSAGGNNLGPSPLEVVLMGAAACMSYDIVSMLKKARVELEMCNAELEAERSPTPPTVFTKINFKFQIKGEVTREQVQRTIVQYQLCWKKVLR